MTTVAPVAPVCDSNSPAMQVADQGKFESVAPVAPVAPILVLLAAALKNGVTFAGSSALLKVRGPKRLAPLMREILARKSEVLDASRCCGERSPGVADRPIVLGCQLCPNSLTYWRNRSR